MKQASAAVATVLLFGGVLSIIGPMMPSMMPVMKRWSTGQRRDMSSQMNPGHQTAVLSERGMPGLNARYAIPVDGELVWDSLRGGGTPPWLRT